jgi:flagellar export protein FliJ
MADQKDKRRSFNYNLETVLNVRGIRKKQEEEKFHKAEKKFLEEKRKEEELKNTQNQKYNELRSLIEAGTEIKNFQSVLMRKAHLERLKGQVDEQVNIRNESEEKKDEQRQELLAAVKKEKIMEKDKERKKISWRKMKDKEEGKELDDIATIGFVRRKRAAIEERKSHFD